MSERAGDPQEAADRIRLLGNRLVEAEAELYALTEGEVDAVLDGNGSPLLLRTAQEALRQAEARSRELIASLPIIACELSGSGEVLSVNRAISDILGYEPEEVVGNPWWRVVGGGQVPPPISGKGGAAEVEQTVCARDGSERTIVWTSTVPSDPAGEADRILLFGVDITARKQAEEAERRLLVERAARAEAEAAERRMSLLSEASRLLATSLRYEATLTAIGRLTVTQVAEYCVVDVTESDGSARRIDAAHPDPTVIDPVREELARRVPMPPGGRCPIREVIDSGVARSIPILSLPQAEMLAGSEWAAELTGRSMISAPLVTRGATLGAITLIGYRGARPYSDADLSLLNEMAGRAALAVDNARLYEAALSASRAKSEFLAVMSHELRTPLNAILGYADLLLLGVPRSIPDAAKSQVERVRLAARHLLQMIEEILTLSRVDAGKEDIRREEVELCEFVEETAALVEPLVLAKNLEFECRPPAGPTYVHLDIRKTRQILLNLLSNAVKFTREGRIALSARVDGPEVSLIVEDSGIGVEPDDVERIFEPFWQAQRGHSRPNEGAGLGLSVTRRLARVMGGEVTVEAGPDGGSRFIATLPAGPASR